MDRISEEIAHFVGLFHLEVEGQRLRLEYDAFALERDEKDRDEQPVPELRVDAPHTLKGFDPGLVYMSAPVKTDGRSAQPFDALPIAAKQPPLPPPATPATEPETALPAIGWEVSWPPFVALPNSILVSIRQTSELWDNDLLLVTGETAFADPEALLKDFLRLIEAADGIGALGPAIAALPMVPTVEAAVALAEWIADFAPDPGVAEVQLLLRGEAARGVYLDGAPVAAGDGVAQDTGGLPAFADLLPAYLADRKAAREAEAETAAGKELPDVPPDGTTDTDGSPFGVDPGHAAVTGANLVTNETTIAQAWIDAPVIAVAKDVIRLDAVSQVNAMAVAPGALGGTTPSQMLNGVSLAFEAAPGPGDPAAPNAAGVFPVDWTIVRVEGDVVAVNWVQQYVFATDFDRAEITVSAAATYIGTGENEIGNGVRLAELGFDYDLILVGGNMVTMNVIEQVNVLLDTDAVGGAAAVPRSGDNLQYNLAELKQTGIDEMSTLQDSFRSALDEMAEGRKTLSREVAQDARFEGKSALRVLQVEGDLIKANIVQQHNFLGDSDQIELLLDGLGAAGAGPRLVTGSNAQLNAARIHDTGLDSEVMVGGEAYSDALIYQAELLDADAPPTGVGLAPLASEAVAFLADDMLEAPPGPDAGPALADADHPAGSDVLHAIMT
ncbi:hypothetical protein P6F26_17860 [Roseibacterium sp. SDUM158017]|uniref:hypothetical protein n=1 Tax=Roseicyclus salinarum TaxID=3036773 RepID=UPI002414F2D5|nr:hypothetical protein [Roseibacterium sp. SDUM158017]MDG4650317.1 hypothetical protein [Roseibacterium sp. SDUM158017]